MAFVTITKQDENNLKLAGTTITIERDSWHGVRTSYSKHLIASDPYWRSIAKKEDVTDADGRCHIVKNMAYVTIQEDAETRRLAFIFGDKGEYVNRITRKGGSVKGLSFEMAEGTYAAKFDADVGGWIIESGVLA